MNEKLQAVERIIMYIIYAAIYIPRSIQISFFLSPNSIHSASIFLVDGELRFTCEPVSFENKNASKVLPPVERNS